MQARIEMRLSAATASMLFIDFKDFVTVALALTEERAHESCDSLALLSGMP